MAGFIFTPATLKMMRTPADTLENSITYLRIYFIGLTAVLIYNMGSSIIRSIGDSRRPLYVLIVCSILNIALDLLLIIVFPLGIAGAAIATVISQVISAMIVTWMLMHSYTDISFYPRELHIDSQTLAAELKIGLPGGILYRSKLEQA